MANFPIPNPIYSLQCYNFQNKLYNVEDEYKRIKNFIQVGYDKFTTYEYKNLVIKITEHDSNYSKYILYTAKIYLIFKDPIIIIDNQGAILHYILKQFDDIIKDNLEISFLTEINKKDNKSVSYIVAVNIHSINSKEFEKLLCFICDCLISFYNELS